MDEDARNQQLFYRILVGGAVLAIVVIAATTLWVGSGARKAADKAVGMVSTFYLQELAGRRSQSVVGTIGERFDQMRRAIAQLDDNDLASQDNLRTFIGAIEDLYGLNLFAVTDVEDVVYTRYATYMGGSRYEFLADDALDQEGTISFTSLYGGTNEVCLALPITGLELAGRPLKACFIKFDIEKIINALDFDTADGQTELGLYYRNGENLTRNGFGPFKAGANILNALGDVIGTRKMEDLTQEFERSGSATVDFDLDDTKQTLYFELIPNTNMILSVLVPDTLIQEQIRGATDGVLSRSAVQIVVTGAVLVAYFVALATITHRISSKRLEEERSNSRAAGERAERSEAELGEVRRIAYRDSLTSVGSKHAYAEREAAIDAEIAEGLTDLAVVVCDVNGLKYVNDTYGHTAGDLYIKKSCKLICDLYDHSPVFRIGGDEFCVILKGEDFARRQEIFEEFNRIVEENLATDGPVVSAGMATIEERDISLHDVFHRADGRMYERKAELKRMSAHTRD